MQRFRSIDLLKEGESYPTNQIYLSLKQTFRVLLTAENSQDIEHFRYLPSSVRTHRFPVLRGYHRYEKIGAAEHLDLDLGPVENDLISCFFSKRPEVFALVGGMGSGKSTTVRYLISKHLQPDQTAIYLNFNHISVTDEKRDIQEILQAIREYIPSHVSQELSTLITPDEERTKLWTWMLEAAPCDHAWVHSISRIKDKLRSKFGEKWASDDAKLIKSRMKHKAQFIKDPLHWITYLCIVIDYYLSEKAQGDRSKICVVFDNLDQYPPSVQVRIMSYAQQIRTQAQCSVLISMRPLTYTRNHTQSANEVIRLIEHIGPSIDELLRHQLAPILLGKNKEIKDFILACGDNHFPFSFKEYSKNGDENITIDVTELKSWCEFLVNSLCSASNSHFASNAKISKTFIEGVSGYSLRAGLVLSQKAFLSSAINISRVINSTGSDLRSHDTTRSLLIDNTPCYLPNNSRIIDNIFDSGCSSSEHNLMCKIRILKILQSQTEQNLKLIELRHECDKFNIEDETLRCAINSLISQTRRLAWSDSVVVYDSLDNLGSSTIHLAPAGAYYIDVAMYLLEYVQEVHYSCTIPKAFTLAKFPQGFKQRIRSLELFLDYLVDVDLDEVENYVSLSSPESYKAQYGSSLITLNIVSSLSDQILRIIGYLRKNKNPAYDQTFDEVEENWRQKYNAKYYKCSQFISCLES